MVDEPRFDWHAIIRVSGIIIGVTAAFGLIVPVVGALARESWNTQNLSGNEIYRWVYWAIAWALTVWQGSWMLREVHDRIIDDMLITSVLAGVILLIVKIVINILYWPISSDGDTLPLITAIDAGGALMLIVVALIGARINKY